MNYIAPRNVNILNYIFQILGKVQPLESCGLCTTRYTSVYITLQSITTGMRACNPCRPLGYGMVYVPLYKVADTPFHIQGAM